MLRSLLWHTLASLLAPLGGGLEEFSFVHWPHPDVCWRAGRDQRCCELGLSEEQEDGCWDDYFTRDRCCDGTVRHFPVPEDECVSSEPLLRPSKDEPFFFLWDEKAGGSTFNRWLLESASLEGLLHSTHISDFWWPNILGSPYFLKLFGEERRRELSILSGTFDWRVVESLCLPRLRPSPKPPPLVDTGGSGTASVDAAGRRPVRCFVLLRDPVDRFISYWLERSDRLLLADGRKSLADVPLDELKTYLDSVRASPMPMSGGESGVGCNREVGLCLDLPPSAVTGAAGDGPPPETEGFRMLRGPQNRLARMLDPEGGSTPRFSVAAARLRRCTVGLIDSANRKKLRAVLAHRAPWIREVLMDDRSDVHVADILQAATGDASGPPRSYSNSGAGEEGGDRQASLIRPRGVRDAMRNHWYGSESRWVRSNLSAAARQLIADYNDVDTPLFQLGVEIFHRQAVEALLHFERQRRPSGSGAAAETEVELKTTWLENHSWAHHFGDLGLTATRFMTDGLRCVLTGRAMPCARFLHVKWPDDRDVMIPPEELRSIIYGVYPDGAVYLM